MDQLVAFLKSAKRLYPFGVPKSLVDSVESNQSSVEPPSQSAKLLLLTPKLSDSARALIIAAMEKGLKITGYEILECTDETSADAILKIKQSAAVINFEAITSLKAGLHESGVMVIRAMNPEVVIQDATQKKEFWNQIQKIIPEIQR